MVRWPLTMGTLSDSTVYAVASRVLVPMVRSSLGAADAVTCSENQTLTLINSPSRYVSPELGLLMMFTAVITGSALPLPFTLWLGSLVMA